MNRITPTHVRCAGSCWKRLLELFLSMYNSALDNISKFSVPECE
jgi:hypothetical protein